VASAAGAAGAGPLCCAVADVAGPLCCAADAAAARRR